MRTSVSTAPTRNQDRFLPGDAENVAIDFLNVRSSIFKRGVCQFRCVGDYAGLELHLRTGRRLQERSSAIGKHYAETFRESLRRNGNAEVGKTGFVSGRCQSYRFRSISGNIAKNRIAGIDIE